MNATQIPRIRQAIAVVLLVLVVLALSAPLAAATENSVGQSAIGPAFSMMDVVGNRSRMIQFSIGAVALGIAMLWWGNKS
jgi:hypothetical protein